MKNALIIASLSLLFSLPLSLFGQSKSVDRLYNQYKGRSHFSTWILPVIFWTSQRVGTSILKKQTCLPLPKASTGSSSSSYRLMVIRPALISESWRRDFSGKTTN